MRKTGILSTTIIGIVVVVMFISFPTKQEVLADHRPYAHYHYEPGTPVVPYYDTPSYLNEDFVLVVRLVLADKDKDIFKDIMPDFEVYARGKTKHIDGDEFKDDGKAKVTLILDREDMSFNERVTVKSTDGYYRDS